MKTVKERALEVTTDIIDHQDEPMAPLIEYAMRELVQEILHVIEEGSTPYKGMTDHTFRTGGPLGLCTCGLQKAAHPGRSASRKAIMREIAALIADSAPSPADEVEDRFKPGGFFNPGGAFVQLPVMTNEDVLKEMREVREMNDRADLETKANKCADDVAAERGRCLEMMRRCLNMYKRNSPPSMDPHEAFAKQTALEYAIMIVGDWSLSADYRENIMPMPY